MYLNARQFARKKAAERYHASLPDCFKCEQKMFVLTESRYHTTYRCAVCGKTLTFKKRG